MSRRKGSKNSRPSYVGKDRVINKATKLKAAIEEFIDLSLRNQYANKEIDYNRLHDVCSELGHLTKNETYE